MKKDLIKICRQMFTVSLFLVMLFSGTGFLSAAARLSNDLTVSEIAPEFKLSSLSGNKASLSDFKGKPVILFIWATWCPYCVRELAYLEKSYVDIKKTALNFWPLIAVSPESG